MRTELSRYLAATTLIGHLKSPATQLGPVTDDIEAYHQARKKERAALMQALSTDLPMASFCSVGAGAAGEESLLNAKLTLIEPDARFAAYLRTKHPGATVIQAPYEEVTVAADVIYAASLGPWMNSDPTLGIHRDFLAFCRRSLNPGGTVVALIYGGFHTGFVLDRRHYLEQLIRSADYTIALYGKYRDSNALLVLTQGPRNLPALSAYISPLIVNGVIQAAAPSRSHVLALLLAIAAYTVRGVMGVLSNALYLFRVNRRLMR